MDSGAKLKAILRNSGWSQDELAYRLGVSEKTLSFWITGRAEPRAKNLEEIEKYYCEIVGRTEVPADLVRATEKKALATSINLDELIENTEMLKTATLFLTYHTNTIEGSTMTVADVEKVLDDDKAILPDRTVREQLEARNHRAAFLYLLSEFKKQDLDFRWTTDLILNTHLRLMNGLIESAGTYRRHGVRIMGSRVPLSNPLSVPVKMDSLVEMMNSPCVSPIERLAITHATFEQIHPFGDGNGRTGRLMMFVQALSYGIVPPLVIKERKRAYYKYLEIAQTREEYELLRLFLAESVLFTDELLR